MEKELRPLGAKKKAGKGAPGDDIVKLGEFIREARHRKDWSIRDLDKASGVSANYIFSIERPGDSTRRPGAEVMGRLADALDLDLNDLYAAVGWRRSMATTPAMDAILKTMAPRPELKVLMEAAAELSADQLEMVINLARMRRP